jgi:protocatechuate 3,4-dioxygenase, alpha subunit
MSSMPELGCTPGQTVGPFFALAMPSPGDSDLVSASHPGATRLHGTVFDGAGAAVPDALVELWQPDADGQIPRGSAGFTGFGRSATDADGRYGFTTVTPRETSPGRPPFFAITVFARGLLHRLFTRAYLPGADPDADPLLSAVDSERRTTLLCMAESDSGHDGYRFDIRLQGPRETVFLAHRDGPR